MPAQIEQRAKWDGANPSRRLFQSLPMWRIRKVTEVIPVIRLGRGQQSCWRLDAPCSPKLQKTRYGLHGFYGLHDTALKKIRLENRSERGAEFEAADAPNPPHSVYPCNP